ncbi:hypothetical protein [Clostridium haemolyticum]|uniref:hypothetical protein n=1 Tax=Clostridium haemolyticum TaxID=84025 RepID=UPI001FA93E86|nr:hypothetical protein [Clostridium haemolyticum]
MCLATKSVCTDEEKVVKNIYENDLENIQEDKKLKDFILTASEEIAFNSQQLLWLEQNNINAFKNIHDMSYKVENYCQQNAASSEEINSSINHFVNFSKNLNESIIKIRGFSLESSKMLNDNKNTIESVNVFFRRA